MKSLVGSKILIFILFQSVLARAADVYGLQDIAQVKSSNGLSEAQSARVDQIVSATAAIVRVDNFNSNELLHLGDYYKFCRAHDWEKQREWSRCSATLIAPNKILTAGHCIWDKKDCENSKIVFNFVDDSSIEQIKKDPDLVYSCKKILLKKAPKSTWDPSVPLTVDQNDYAILELDRNVVGRTPISLASQKPLGPHEKIYGFGYPEGTPQKLTVGYNDETSKYNNSKNYFQVAGMQSAAGLSGGGIYNSSFELIGILVRGSPSFEFDHETRPHCGGYKECTAESCSWTQFQKLNFVPHLLSTRSSHEHP